MEVIEGKKRAKKELSKLYQDVFIRFTERVKEKSFEQMRKDKELLQYVFLAVKNICAVENKVNRKENVTMLYAEYYLIENAIAAMAYITPRELLQIFPPTKCYDGAKWQTKDYFTTMKAMQKYGLDEPMQGKVLDILWDFMNFDISLFMVEWIGCVSDMTRYQTGKNLLIDFFHSQGIKTYNYIEKDGYLIDEQTGKKTKVTKAKKRVPKHLKIIQKKPL